MMPISVPPAGLILDGQIPDYGGMKTGNLILNGDMENNEFGTVWTPSLFTLGVESTSAGAWVQLTASPHAGLSSLKCTLTKLVVDKPAYCYQSIPLNPGAQYDQLSLWHRIKYDQNCDADIVANCTIRVKVDLVDSAGALTNLLTWDTTPNTGWLACTREFRPSDLTTRAIIDASVSMRVTLNVWPTANVGGPVAYVALFDDLTLEAEAAFSRNFSVGSTFEHERNTAFERGTDYNRTMHQASSGQGTAKRTGTLVFRYITEAQMAALHGLWLYGGRSYVIWYPVMETYPESINVVFDRKWAFAPANNNVGVGYSGTLGWMEH